MIGSIFKLKLKKIWLACLFGMIVAGLVGCSNTNSVPVLPSPAQTTTNRSLKVPEVISLRTNPTSLSLNGLVLNVEAKVMNHNPFIINIQNPSIRIKGVNGPDYCRSTAPDSQIAGIAVQTFNFSATVPPEALKEQNLTIGIDLNSEYAGATLPVSDSLTFDLREILNKYYVKPKVSLQAKFETISWNGLGPQVEARVQGTIDNPNPSDLVVKAINITAAGQKGNPLGSSSIEGDFTISANSDYSFETVIILPVWSLNEADISVLAVIPASTLYSMDSLNGRTSMSEHKLADLIKVPKMVLDAKADWIDVKPLPNLKLMISTSIANDNQYDLTNGDLLVKVVKPANSVLDSTPTQSNVQGIPAFDTKEMTNQITLVPGTLRDLGGDATINTSIRVGIQNVNETIPISSTVIFRVAPPWPY